MVQNGSRAVAAEDGLDLVTVHPIADPDPDAAIPEGLAAAVDLPDIEGGDGVVERHLARLLPHSPIGISARLTWPPPFRRANQDADAKHSPARKHDVGGPLISLCV
jgi:hypothetical protein